MSALRTRALTVGAAMGTALVLAAAPAGAAGSPLTATEPGAAARPSGEAEAGVLDAPQAVEGAARAAVGYNVRNLRCFPNNVVFDALTFENGRSGVQQFRQRAQLQELTSFGWVNRSATSVVNSTRFPNNATSFRFDRHWTGSHVNNGAAWRVKWQGLYLNGFGQVIARTPNVTATCF